MNSQVKNFFQKTTALVAITSIMTGLTAEVANALDVSAGNVNHSANVNINQLNNVTNINHNSAKEVITWGNFNISQPETVNFNSNNASNITINKVTGGSRSLIEGMLNSNHRVAILNDAGVTFTRDARVNVGSLIATTAKDFNESANQYRFTNVNGTGSVINQGNINVSDGGYAVLVAPEVRNEGTITAKLGRVDLAAANGFTIDVNGNGNINYLAGPDLQKAIVTNTGTVNALGGIVNLRADKASSLADSVINLNGVVNVDGMDSNVIGTAPNGSAIIANSYGDLNVGSDLRAGHIKLASADGNISTQALTSINEKTLNTERAIDIQAAKGRVTVNGDITARNKLNTDTGIAKAEVYIKGTKNVREVQTTNDPANPAFKEEYTKGVNLKGDVNILAENKSGGTAKLDVHAGAANAITDGKINVNAAGTRIVDLTKGEDGGNITSTAEVNFTGYQVRHNDDVNVKAYAFHDIRHFIEYLSKTTSANDHSAFGFYKKDQNGNPTSGEILFSDLASILPGSWADLSFVDFNDVGYFLIPNASALRGGLTNRQVVNFAQVGGQWVVQDTAGNTIQGLDIGHGNNYALFSDKTLNKSGEKHLLNSANGEGELNWETVITQFCDYNDYNFKLTEQGGPGAVKTHAAYNANATHRFYTPVTGANIYVDSTADAKNSEATAELNIVADIITLGDPHITSRAYKNSYSKANLHAKNGDLFINAPLVSQSYAKSRAVGSANSELTINVNNGQLNFGHVPNSYLLSDALGGVKANANTVVNVNGQIAMGDMIGSIAKTFDGNVANSTASTTINTTLPGRIYFRPKADPVNFPGTVDHPEGYAFSNSNGVIVSGGSTKSNGTSSLRVLNGATVATNTTYVAGSGDTHTPYKNTVNCGVANPCDSNPNTNTVGGWKTTTTTTGGNNQPDTSTEPYGPGMTVPPIGMPPYQRIDVKVFTKTPPIVSPDPNLLYPNPVEEPSFVKNEPASGGGLFCRDVNTAGVPGLCGPAPMQMALAPIVEEAPAPVYASPFKKGPSTAAKKAQVANLEPGSGNKCLSINGKKVCIEEQIDK